MRVPERVTRSAAALVLVALIGTAGYMLVEGWSLLDALYMTVITVTTVGYDEVRPLSQGGQIFSIFLMVGGVGVILYVLSTTVQTVIEGQIVATFWRRRRMHARLGSISEHYILCGYGRVGREVARGLQREQERVVVVDLETEAIGEADDAGIPYIQDDATHNETLRRAGIDRARGLVAALGDDSDNVFVTLTARGLNPDITIVARSSYPETAEKLRMAGAHRVVSPYAIGGRRMALAVTRPMALDFFDTLIDRSGAGVRMTEVRVTEDSPLSRKTIEEWRSSRDMRILAVARRDGELLLSPDDGTRLEPGDGVMVVGPDSELQKLEGRQ